MKLFLLNVTLLSSLFLFGCSAEDSASDGSFSGAGSLPPQGSSEAPADAAVAPQPDPAPETDTEAEPDIDSEATSFFFSYDESGSTAARDLSLFAISEGRRPDPSLGRPFEFLNAEELDSFDAQALGPFQVSMGLLASEVGDIPLDQSPEGLVYSLGINVSGPGLSREERPNVVLTLLVDVSGSMDSPYANETRSDVVSLLDVAKYGMVRLQPTLKPGDVLNLITFSTEANVVLEGVDAGQSDFTESVNALQTESSTNIGAGIDLAYRVANRTFDPDKANRVLILTDAFVNTGSLDPMVIAEPTVINGLEGIYFSAIGVGAGFDDSVLETLAETGRGTYSAMITPNDAERLFTYKFNRFISPAVVNVRFQLTYPQSLDQLQSNAEEISTNADEVQPVQFSFNTSQTFLELFSGAEDIDPSETITFGIEFEGSNGEPETASLSNSIGQLRELGEQQIRTSLFVVTLAQLISGRLECDTVTQSRLFQEPLDTDVGARYRQAIEAFCAI